MRILDKRAGKKATGGCFPREESAGGRAGSRRDRRAAEHPADRPHVELEDRFRVASSNEEFALALVYPKDVDESGGTISVLAPVGSALLGLSQGDEIEWPKPGGGTRKVRIEELLTSPSAQENTSAVPLTL